MTPGGKMTEVSQKPIIDWLQATLGQAIPGTSHDVVVKETSAALIFLTGDQAYKMKRAVDLGYLDFRRLADREAVCRRELTLNQPIAPDLYLGIAHVTQAADGTLALNGDGIPIEPLVVMRRFADDDLAAHALDQGRIDDRLIHDFGTLIAGYHRTAPETPTAAPIAARIAQCLEAAQAMAGDVPAERLGRIAAVLLAEAQRFAGEETARAKAGLLRRGHGDLHFGNLCLLDNRLMPFDALEFSEALASGDVLYDLAFAVMDLRLHNRPDLALTLFDSYSDAAPDLALPCRLLPLFVALRALIRAFANHAGWRVASTAGQREPPPLALINRYLDLLEQAIPAQPPRLVAVGGLSGSGKSTLARALAPSLRPLPGAMVLRSDLLRKELAGVAPHVRLPPAQYTPESACKVYEMLIDRATALLAAGRSVIVDAVFARPDERAAIAAVATRQGLTFDGLWLDISETAAMARIAARRGDASDATPAVAARQRHYDIGPLTWTRIDADGPFTATLAAAHTSVTPITSLTVAPPSL